MTFHNKLEHLALASRSSLVQCLRLAGAYQSEAPLSDSTLGIGSWPYPQALDLGGNICQRQML